MTAPRKTALWALALAIICCGLMALIDGYIRPSYGIKSAVKIVLFLCLPLALFRKQKPLFSRFRAEKRGLLTALGLGFGVYAVILAAYFLINGMGWYDFSGIVGQLSANAGVHPGNFLFISLYISFANSLLEEYFFRGWLFDGLAPLGSIARWSLCCGLFALYHVAMMTGWFSPVLFVLAMTGLAAGAAIFHWLNLRYDTLLTSWLVHMFANFAINTIGFLLMT